MDKNIENAKRKVGEVFKALAFDHCRDIHWKERVLGGWEVTTSLVSNRLYGFVSDTGFYSVEVHTRNGSCMATLISGSFDPGTQQSVGAVESVSYQRAPE